MVDPTLQESLYKASIRKYFTDFLETSRGYHVYFDVNYSIPKVNGVELNNWVIFHFGDISLDILSKATLSIYCFSRKDADADALSVLRDNVMDCLFDSTQTDGLAKIPYYDSLWNKISGIVPLVMHETEADTGADGTNYKVITVRMNWGTK